MKNFFKKMLEPLFYAGAVGLFFLGLHSGLKTEDYKAEYQACGALLEKNEPCSATQVKAREAYILNNTLFTYGITLTPFFLIFAGDVRRQRDQERMRAARKTMDKLMADAQKEAEAEKNKDAPKPA
jgi:hypothetical protein